MPDDRTWGDLRVGDSFVIADVGYLVRSRTEDENGDIYIITASGLPFVASPRWTGFN